MEILIKKEVLYRVGCCEIIVEVELVGNAVKKDDKKPKVAPLVYINRLKMSELDVDNKYEFIPDIVDKDGNIINRDDLRDRKSVV